MLAEKKNIRVVFLSSGVNTLFWPIFSEFLLRILLILRSNYFENFLNTARLPPPRRGTATMETASTPPPRKRGVEVSLGRRYALATEAALAIPPGKTRLPKGVVAAPLAQRYGVGPEYPAQLQYGKTAKHRSTAPRKLTSQTNLAADGRRCLLKRSRRHCGL